MTGDVRRIVESLGDKYLKWWRPTSDGKNIYGACPFHHEKTEGAFYMSTETGLFICHACQARGTLSSFLKEVGAPARVRSSIMEVAGPILFQRAQHKPLVRQNVFENHMPIRERILGIFDFCPTHLVDAGFNKRVLRDYDIGFDKDALRITFPIRNHLGVLMGISGRTVINEIPRYKIYKEKDLLRFSEEYKGYDFNKKYFVWNMHNVYPEAFHGELKRVVVVEGFKAALWLIQHGFRETVALMGTYMSEMQRALLQRFSADIYILLDNTDEGMEGAYQAGKRLRRSNRVWICSYPDRCEDGDQPDDLSKVELTQSVDKAVNFNRWRKGYERSRPKRRLR
jgi:DNA primase